MKTTKKERLIKYKARVARRAALRGPALVAAYLKRLEEAA